METDKRYICNINFPKLGLEVGDYFPTHNYTEEAIQKAVEDGKIEEDNEEYFVTH